VRDIGARILFEIEMPREWEEPESRAKLRNILTPKFYQSSKSSGQIFRPVAVLSWCVLSLAGALAQPGVSPAFWVTPIAPINKEWEPAFGGMEKPP
jgi:hypothetical protein